MIGFAAPGHSADEGDSRKKRWVAVVVVVALVIAGWNVASRLRPPDSIQHAIRDELASDPLLTHLLERSGRTLPSNAGTEIFGITMLFAKDLTPDAVEAWAREDPYRAWSPSAPSPW